MAGLNRTINFRFNPCGSGSSLLVVQQYQQQQQHQPPPLQQRRLPTVEPSLRCQFATLVRGRFEFCTLETLLNRIEILIVIVLICNSCVNSVCPRAIRAQNYMHVSNSVSFHCFVLHHITKRVSSMKPYISCLLVNKQTLKHTNFSFFSGKQDEEREAEKSTGKG